MAKFFWPLFEALSLIQNMKENNYSEIMKKNPDMKEIEKGVIKYDGEPDYESDENIDCEFETVGPISSNLKNKPPNRQFKSKLLEFPSEIVRSEPLKKISHQIKRKRS